MTSKKWLINLTKIEKGVIMKQLKFFDFNEKTGTNFNIGDKVKLNQRYFDEGLALFGNTLKYPKNKKHYFEVKKCVAIKGNPDLIYIDDKQYKKIEVIAACFLQKIL